MSQHLTSTMIKEIITDPEVITHLISLQKKLKKEFSLINKKNPESCPNEMIDAIQESPNTTQWVKNIVIPKIYNGDEGLEEILIEIEKEKNIILSATRMQIVLDILQSLPDNLNALKEGIEEGEYNMEENIDNFEHSITYKIYH